MNQLVDFKLTALIKGVRFYPNLMLDERLPCLIEIADFIRRVVFDTNDLA